MSYFKIFLPLRYPKVRSHKAPVNLTSKATFPTPTPSLLSPQHTRLFIPTPLPFIRLFIPTPSLLNTPTSSPPNTLSPLPSTPPPLHPHTLFSSLVNTPASSSQIPSLHKTLHPTPNLLSTFHTMIKSYTTHKVPASFFTYFRFYAFTHLQKAENL